MGEKSIEEMKAKIEECYCIAEAKKSTTAAKIKAMRKVRKAQFAIYKKEMATLNEKSVRATPDKTYVLSQEKVTEIVDRMIRFGVLRNAK
jgi:hypothetical protein